MGLFEKLNISRNLEFGENAEIAAHKGMAWPQKDAVQELCRF